MATRPSRLERITNLVLALLDTARPISLREIGTAVSGYPSEPGALRQAFERDKRTLRDGGIPVLAERIDGEEQVGYRIDPAAYYLPELDLDEAEQAAVAFAVAAVRLEGGVGADALAKLGAPHASELPPVVVLPTLPALGRLQEAVRRRAVARFAYHDREREVEGYGLVFKAGSWYFVGRDRSVLPDGAVRTFRVDRVAGDVASGDGAEYEPPADFDAGEALRFLPWAIDGPEERADSATEVEVAIDVREARAAIGLVGEAAVVAREADGSVVLHFAVGDEQAFVSWVLGLGDAAEVRSPAPLRDAVVDRLRGAAGFAVAP